MGLPNNLADWKTTSNYTGKVPSTFYLLENSYSVFLSALQSLSIPPPPGAYPPHATSLSQSKHCLFLFISSSTLSSNPSLALHPHCHTLVQTPPSLNCCYHSQCSLCLQSCFPSPPFMLHPASLISPVIPPVKPSVLFHCMQNKVQTLIKGSSAIRPLPACPVPSSANMYFIH